jgi:acylphosphatase
VSLQLIIVRTFNQENIKAPFKTEATSTRIVGGELSESEFYANRSENEKMKTRAHVLIQGRVQGVFFRSEIMHQAKIHGVKGWVHNLPDGRVEAEFEGEEENVEKLLEFCKHGPPEASVKNVEVTRKTFTGDLKGFEIEY